MSSLGSTLKKTTTPSWLPNFGLEGRSIEPLIHGVFGPKECQNPYNTRENNTETFSFVRGTHLDYSSRFSGIAGTAGFGSRVTADVG
jgi:hypothetical protein